MIWPFAIATILQSGIAQAGELQFEPTSTALWGAASIRSVVEGPFNPLNASARAPSDLETLEARPDWSLSYSPLRLTARPRFLLTREHGDASRVAFTDTTARLRWSEAFLKATLSEDFTVVYGLQNFQWGPAESASPSNRIFRDTVQARDSLYVEKGHHLLRLSWAPSASWSEVLLLEPTSNGDEEPEAGEKHAVKGLLKSELSWAGGSNFAGLVLGWREWAGPWLGEYLNLEALDGLFLYLDASHQKGSLALYPETRGSYLTYSQSKRNASRLFTFLVSGARYAFENGNDVRLEWVFQEAGYSRGDFASARAAAGSSDLLQLAILSAQQESLRRPDLDFPGIQSLFASARFPNAWGARNWNLYIRGLSSLQDGSLATFFSSENAIGERGTLVGNLGATFGAPGDELKGDVDFSATLAYRHAW